MNSISPQPPKLLDQLRASIRFRHYSLRTEQAYVHWVKRFIFFHDKRHPKDMGGPEVEAFLTYLADVGMVAVSTHQQALSALLFLYREVLKQDLPWLSDMGRPKTPKRLPVVLTETEVRRLLDRINDQTYQLMARLLYGSGMRLMECVRLRVKDVEFDRREIVVRSGKGDKDRVTMLPGALVQPLQAHLERVKEVWLADRAADRPGVQLPNALEKKYPNAPLEWAWFWVFPAPSEAKDPRTGIIRRHHLYEQNLQRSIKLAVQIAGIAKPATTHTLRHSFATHLFQP